MSRHSNVQGVGTSMPRVATESRKHVARSEDSSDGTSGKFALDKTSDRKLVDRGVSVRPGFLPLPASVSDMVGVDEADE